ncbi:dicarboxylate/amino acid:cation symporter [Flammeovirga kamogawensis]|uniref:Dicarboxylate/amino acid:cation symporter n=1 Tax=Flammeovirga kamogawensis TaxID=373891 RepID=A0ABX8GST2_9BACT|nr:dicarboxylate/amino acid:cation symporter [Flammeovirga kamogawensis]MBB6463373.1 Na+/H+-dicarboxylate symporter [Flammeovirga kamogawensis]QWG06655.1 dicarboxylate/amino acid:cation symporter [Flammeovirga kamogawensis]TRX68477.1 dicarboxylate/amino acid:cation symporter [Flammeovirga kamogawensis]
MKFFKVDLGIAILIAMILGIILGIIFGEDVTIIAPIGDVFIKLLSMLVIPLVFFSIIMGAQALGQSKNASKIGGMTFLYFGATSFVAVFVGILFTVLFKPGIGLNIQELAGGITDTSLTSRGEIAGFWDTIKGAIPSNPFKALSQGSILQIILFSMFFGIGIGKLPDEKQKVVSTFIEGVNDVLVWMIIKVMWLAPFGVMCLMASSVGTFGYDILFSIGKLFIVYILALIVVTFPLFGGMVQFFSKVPAIKFFKEMVTPQIFALSTASSLATLPLNYEAVDKMGVKKSVASFVLPLGATVNMAGNAVFNPLVTIFFAQMYGIELGMSQYIAIAITSVLGAVGTAGVPGPSLLAVAVFMVAGVPVEALPLIFGVDRIFDMLRTAVNITGDASCAVVMERFEEED